MRVSIIIPVYNVAPYIEACLVSVMHQTYNGEMECLLIDDCGTDDSILIAQRMMTQYDGAIRFRILHHEYNRGLSAARNTGTDAAIGEYLYYLDSDDVITPDCIERLMEEVRKSPEVEMVQGNASRHLLDGGEIPAIEEVTIHYANSNKLVRRCYFQNNQLYVNVWNKLLRRDFVVNNCLFCMEGLLYEDNLWTFYLVKYLKNAIFLQDITYHQYKRPMSITTGMGEEVRIKSFITIYQDILTHLTPGFEKEEYNYYVKCIVGSYFSNVRIVPQFKDVLKPCQRLGRRYGSWKDRIRLAMYSFLGHFRNGQAVWRVIMSIYTHLCLSKERSKPNICK